MLAYLSAVADTEPLVMSSATKGVMMRGICVGLVKRRGVTAGLAIGAKTTGVTAVGLRERVAQTNLRCGRRCHHCLADAVGFPCSDGAFAFLDCLFQCEAALWRHDSRSEGMMVRKDHSRASLRFLRQMEGPRREIFIAGGSRQEDRL